MAKRKNSNPEKEKERLIEYHLKKMRTYKTAINNLQEELDYILPGITSSYEYREGTAGTFTITSKTENAVIDRVESSRAVHLNESKKRYEMLVDAMSRAVENLSADEQKFVELRYFLDTPYEKVADMMKCSASYMFKVRKSAMENLRISLAQIAE